MAVSQIAGTVEGVPRILLRLEGIALAAGSVYMYQRIGANWWLFAALILAPDLSMLGYFAGTRVGAIAYNAFHVTLGPLICAALGFLLPSFDLLSIALIWAEATTSTSDGPRPGRSWSARPPSPAAAPGACCTRPATRQ